MSAALLIAALIAGKIGLAALTAADWTILAQAGFTAARVVILIGAKIERDIVLNPVLKQSNLAGNSQFQSARLGAGFRVPNSRFDSGDRGQILCFQGAPSGQAARFC